MGWTSHYRRKGMSDLEWFKGEFPEAGKKVIAGASVRRSVFYAVYETEAEKEPRLVPDENGKVRLAIVVLTKWAPRDPHYNFTYKDMDEFCGPVESDCPERILDMLSPFKPEVIASAGEDSSTKWSLNWRERCRANIAKRKKAITLTDGMYVRLPEPLSFVDGSKEDTFKVVKLKGSRRVRFRHVLGYGFYVLPRQYREQLVELKDFDPQAYWAELRAGAEAVEESARAWEAERPDMYGTV